MTFIDWPAAHAQYPNLPISFGAINESVYPVPFQIPELIVNPFTQPSYVFMLTAVPLQFTSPVILAITFVFLIAGFGVIAIASVPEHCGVVVVVVDVDKIVVVLLVVVLVVVITDVVLIVVKVVVFILFR